ncbi:hypothetical protein E4U41_002528 [Claviceps citrina]|nr:hypothetical protein E4U41_002528 [Claviceps citrina]
MAPDDLNTAQDAVVGVGPARTSKDSSSATPENAPVPVPGPRRHPDTAATTPGTADDPPSRTIPVVQNSTTTTTTASSPRAPSVSIELLAATTAPTATATATATETATETTAATATATTTATTATTPPPTTTAAEAPEAPEKAEAAAATASTTNEIDPIVPETSAAPTASPQAAVQTATSASSSPAPVAAPASPSQLRPNGDGKASETDSAMASYRPPAHTSHHGLPVSYSAAGPTTHLATSASAYAASSTGMAVDTQFSSYPASGAAASHANEGYRVSPVPSSNPMSLPSMRTIDAMSQRGSPPYGPHHPVSMSMSAALTPVSSSPSSYYTNQHAMPVPSNYALPSDSLVRYPLPHDPRVLGSRGPKKEIKRRTKTGCLTCRKRRIKCDETHPTCNNCKKSKRECLGYDPIFRQQPGGQPNSHIQPAPTTVGQLTVSSSAPSSAPSSSAAHSASVAIGHPPANSYGSQPSMLPSSYSTTPSPSALHSTTATATATATTTTAHTVTASSNFNSPDASSTTPCVKIEPGFEFSAPIDRSTRHLPAPNGQELAKPFDCHKDNTMTASGDAAYKKMKITDIIDLLGPPPPPQQISHTEETFNEITKVYHEMYASGLSAFLETSWYYFVENGTMSFPKDANLIEHMATFLKILEAVKANDHSQMAYSGVLETRIVWELACTAYQTPDRTNHGLRVVMPPDGDATEARNRLRVVDTLLCGEYLATNPLAPPLPDADVHRTRQFDFWYSLAEFVKRQDSPDAPHAVRAREDALTRMRHLLDGRENRDVLYSIAVVRELAPSYGPSYGSPTQHLDESDPKNRLAVASKFILDEAQVTGGTTNVVRRFSDIASRAFVNPAVNVVRRTG